MVGPSFSQSVLAMNTENYSLVLVISPADPAPVPSLICLLYAQTQISLRWSLYFPSIQTRRFVVFVKVILQIKQFYQGE